MKAKYFLKKFLLSENDADLYVRTVGTSTTFTPVDVIVDEDGDIQVLLPEIVKKGAKKMSNDPVTEILYAGQQNCSILSRILGLKGSWKWAVKQMMAGKIVKPVGITGAVKYRIDSPENGLLQWAFFRSGKPEWERANFFPISDGTCEWEVWDEQRTE